MTSAIKLLRAAGLFVGNFLTATIATNVFASEFSHIYAPRTIAGALHREYVLSAILALPLGYFVFYKWHWSEAKWVWVAGAIWFAERVISLGHERPSVLSVPPSVLDVARNMFDPPYAAGRTLYAFILIRTFFYSVGAWTCSCEMKYGGSSLSILKKCLNALRGKSSAEA